MEKNTSKCSLTQWSTSSAEINKLCRGGKLQPSVLQPGDGLYMKEHRRSRCALQIYGRYETQK